MQFFGILLTGSIQQIRGDHDPANVLDSVSQNTITLSHNVTNHVIATL